MSRFSESVADFCEHFWDYVQPHDQLVQEMAGEASHVGDLESGLALILAGVDKAFDYQRTPSWLSNQELQVSQMGDCKSLSLFVSGVLFAMGQPHYIVLGHLDSQTASLPEFAEEGHVWVEVEDGNLLYILEPTVPVLYVVPKGRYAGTPYLPVERIRIS